MSDTLMSFGGIFLLAALTMIAIVQARPRAIWTLIFVFIFLSVALWWVGVFQDKGLRSGENIFVLVMFSTPLIIGGAVGFGIGRALRNWRERHGYCDD